MFNRCVLDSIFVDVDQFRKTNFKGLPSRVEVFNFPLSSINLGPSIVLIGPKHFKVGVAFIPKIKPRVSIVEILSPPLHLQIFYIHFDLHVIESNIL